MTFPARFTNDAQTLGRHAEEIRQLRLRRSYEVGDWVDLVPSLGTSWYGDVLQVRQEGDRAWLYGSIQWQGATGTPSIPLDTGSVPADLCPPLSNKIFPQVDYENYSEATAANLTIACSMVVTSGGQIGSSVFTRLDGTTNLIARTLVWLELTGISWPLS